MKIQKVTDKAFAPYGRILEGYDTVQLMKVMEHTPLPKNEVVYVASCEALEELEVKKQFERRAFGNMPVQIGYCNGQNRFLNALEYHRCSEVNVAVTDVIVILGRQQDVEADYTYDTAKTEAFLIPAGTAVEIYATTLHYAPCMAEEKGFRWVVILPKGTNEDMPESAGGKGEEKLAAARNKWLIAHKDAEIKGAFCGLKGENYYI